MSKCRLCDEERGRVIYVGKKIRPVCRQCENEIVYRHEKLKLNCMCGSTKIRRVKSSELYECLDCTVVQQKKYFEGE